MKKTTSKKLFNYSAMSAALLGATGVIGQIGYTDLEPDEVINAGESLNIDINGDGISDFSAHVINGFGDGLGARLITAPDIDPVAGGAGSTGNGFAGIATGEYRYVSNLIEGSTLDQNASIQTNARGDLNLSSCAYNNSQFCDGVVDGYMGVTLNLDSNTHFGWIRVDVAEDASTFTIKDFAIETTPDTAIEVGDMGDGTPPPLSLEDNVIEGLSSYVANNALTINARNPLESIAIHNLSGQVVISTELTNATEIIDITSLSTGAYIASIQSEGTITAIKFVK